jgi:hypothetical protein
MIGGSSPARGWEFFFSPPPPDRLWDSTASYPVRTRGSFYGVKRPGREVDHSPPSSSAVKNAWSYASTPPIRLHGVVLSSSTGTTLPFPYPCSAKQLHLIHVTNIVRTNMVHSTPYHSLLIFLDLPNGVI